MLIGIAHRHLARPRPVSAKRLAEQVVEIGYAEICSRHAGNLELGQASHIGKFDLDFLVVQLPVAQLAAETLARCRARRLADQCVENPLLRSEEHTSELQSRENLVCRLLLEKKKKSISHKHDYVLLS